MDNAQTHTAEIVQVHAPAEHHAPTINGPEVQMMVFTWAVFFILLGILYKFAWKPILALLDSREESIRKSVENAERIKTEMEAINQRSQEILGKAQLEAKIILDESRKAAQEAARTIEQKAKNESQIILDNAQREIKNASERAQAELKKQSVDLAIKLASKIMEENLDNEKNQKLIEKAINQI